MTFTSRKLCGLLVVCSLCAATPVTAQTDKPAPTGLMGADSVSVLTGWSVSTLDRHEDYEVLPVIVRVGFDADPFFARLGLETDGMSLNIEPFVSPVVAPENRLEAGCAFMLRWEIQLPPETLHMFLEGGVGPMITTLDMDDQSHFNFIDQAGTGLIVSMTPETRIEAGIRCRHVSNAGFDDDNAGLDGVTGLVGVTRLF